MALATNNELFPDAHHHIDEVNIACGAQLGEELGDASRTPRTAVAVLATVAVAAALGILFL